MENEEKIKRDADRKRKLQYKRRSYEEGLEEEDYLEEWPKYRRKEKYYKHPPNCS